MKIIVILEFGHLSTLGSQRSVVTTELIHILGRVRVLAKDKYENKKKTSKHKAKYFMFH